MSQAITPDNTPNMLYCMQLRCGDRRILVPRSVVIEVKAYAPPEPLLDPISKKPINGPEWILGSTRHHDQHIPVLSLEKLIDAESASQEQARICIMQAIGEALKPAYYAVICQGFPTLLEVPATLASTLAEQKAPENPDSDNDLIASQVQLGGTYSAIPDLPQIESVLSQALTEAAALGA